MKKILFLFAIVLFGFSDAAFLEGSALRDVGSFSGTASWYSRYDPGVRRHTASTEVFNDQVFTCAVWGVPFGTILEVTNLENGKSILVRVNDRGPAKRFVRRGRVIDLTKTAFARIAGTRSGLVKVLVTVKSVL